MGGTALQEIGRSLRVLHVMPERGEERRLLLSAVHCESLSPTTPPPNFQGSSGVCILDIYVHIFMCVGRTKGLGLRFKQRPSKAQALAGMQREEEVGEKRLYSRGPWATLAKS